MKKLSSIALALAVSVIMLICTGCTTDYGADLKQIEERVDKLEETVAALIEFKAVAQAQIDKNAAALSLLRPQVLALAEEIDRYSTATDKELAAITEKIGNMVTEITAAITNIVGRVSELDAAAAKAQSLLAEIRSQIEGLSGRIRSIVAEPSTAAEFKHISAQGVDTTDVFECCFEFGAKDAIKNVKAEDFTLLVREGTNKAAVDIEIPVAQVLPFEDENMLYVKAVAKLPEMSSSFNRLYYSLKFTGKDSADSTYEIQSPYTKAAKVENVTASCTMAYNGEKQTPKFKVTDSLDYTALKPLQIFEGFDVMYAIGEDYLTLAQLANYLGVDPMPELVFKDSIIRADLPFVCDTARRIFSFKTDGFTSKELIGKTGFMIARVYVGGQRLPLEARENVCIWKHNQCIDPMSDPQVIRWSYVNHAAVDYKAYRVPVPTVVYDSKDVTLGTDRIYKSADPARKSVSGKVNITDIATVSGKTTATVVITDVAPGELEVDYNYIQNAYDDTLNLVAQIPFTVMPRPLDKEDIVLSDTAATYLTAGFNAGIAPVQAALIYADTTEYFAGLPAGDANRDLELLRAAFASSGIVTVQTLRENGTEIKTDEISRTISGITLAYDAATGKETSFVKFTGNVVPGATYDLVFAVEAFGVTYTFSQKIAVSKVPFKLSADPLFVKDGIVTLTGIIGSDRVYKIDSLDILNYIKLEGYVPSDETGVKVNFKLYNELGKTTKDTDKGIENLPDAPAAKAVAGSTISGPARIGWRNPGGDYTATKLMVKSYLTDKNGVIIGDTLAITLQTPAPVKDFSGGRINADRINGQDLEIKLWSSMSASSCLADTNILAPKADSLTAALNKTAIDYGQALESIDIADVKAALNGEPYTLDGNYFSISNGKLIVRNECGKFTAPLVITVPVKLDYYLDYTHKQALESKVEITVTQK